MAWRLTRREFLRVSSLTLLGLFFNEQGRRPRIDPITRIELDADDERVSYRECMQLCLRLGRAAQTLQLSTWRPPLTEETLLSWSQEVSLQMEAEGLVDTPPVPKDLSYFQPTDGNEANHTLAYTDCETYIKLSDRFHSPMTGWYNSPDWVAAVAHELVHLGAQKGDLCWTAPDDWLEATATIGGLVVLSAMANRGNGIAMRSFVWEFLDVCMGAAHSLALKSNQQAEFQKLRQLIYPGILSETRYQKLNREYEDRQNDLMEILQKYYLLPLEIIMRGHLTNHDKLEGLILQPKTVYRTSTYASNPASTNGRVLDLRDWSWLIGHLQEMSQAFADLPVDSAIR